jgi:hypothetical protein
MCHIATPFCRGEGRHAASPTPRWDYVFGCTCADPTLRVAIRAGPAHSGHRSGTSGAWGLVDRFPTQPTRLSVWITRRPARLPEARSNPRLAASPSTAHPAGGSAGHRAAIARNPITLQVVAATPTSTARCGARSRPNKRTGVLGHPPSASDAPGSAVAPARGALQVLARARATEFRPSLPGTPRSSDRSCRHLTVGRRHRRCERHSLPELVWAYWMLAVVTSSAVLMKWAQPEQRSGADLLLRVSPQTPSPGLRPNLPWSSRGRCRLPKRPRGILCMPNRREDDDRSNSYPEPCRSGDHGHSNELIWARLGV